MNADTARRHRQPIFSSYNDVEVDLTLLVFHGLLPTMVIAILSATGLTATLAVHYQDRFLAVQAVVTFVVSTARMIVVYMFTRADTAQLKTSKARQWQTIYGSITFLHCSIMALTTAHTFRFHPYEGGWLCGIGIFCVCIGLGARTGMRPWIVQACGGVLLVTLAFSLACGRQPIRWAAVTMVVFFIYQFCYALQSQFAIAVEQLRLRRKFRALSEQDVLTGLANRRHFEASLATLCSSGELFAILYIDLDRFKHVNDLYGHAAGDTLLIQVGQRLHSAIRPTDLLARLGGDEFAILQTPLLADNSNDSAKALAARINNDIGEPFHIDGHVIGIGASIGIRLSGTGQTDANTLLGKADQALYLVKQAGGGSFSLATA